MALHLSLWMLLGGSCFLSGHLVLFVLRLDEHFPRAYDRFFISVWLGIAIIAPLLLAISIFTALTPAVAAIVFGVAVTLSFCHQTNVRAMKGCQQAIPPGAVGGTVFVALGVAAYASQVITWSDTGLYHLQAIKWLAEYGTVPGVVLIHERLGFASSWFALTAPLDHGALKGHVYSSLGGFALFMMIHALGVGLSRMAGGRAKAEDIFLAVACLLAIPPILFWRMAVSPSPDVPVIVLTIVIAWIYLVAARVRPAGGPVDIHLLPLILALGAVTIKLSALPLALVAGFLYFLNGPSRLRRLALAGCAGMAFLCPYMAVNTITSGYPLYPSTLLHLDLPWTLDAAAVQNLEIVIREWARWGGRPTPVWGNGWDWILPWVVEHLYYTVGIIASLVSCVTVLRSFGRPLNRARGEASVALQLYGGTMAVALAGLIFSGFKAPELRFGLGYVVVMPALIAALCIERRLPSGRPWPCGRLVNLITFGLATLLGVSLHVCWIQLPAYAKVTAAIREGKLPTEDSPRVNWILPPSVLKFYYQGAGREGVAYACEPLHYVQDVTDGMTYCRPEQADGYQCWDAPLPCAPDKLANVRLREPRQGLAAGLARSSGE